MIVEAGRPHAAARIAAFPCDVDRWLVAGALLVCVIAFFVDLARTPLFDVDEGAFAQTTIEMLQRGDFVSPHLNGQLRADKPILTYWLQAASVRALGINEFALRLPSAICGIGWIVLTGAFATRYFGRKTGWLAAGILGLSLGVTTMARAATADALLNMLIAASMFAAWLCLDTRKRVWLYAAAAAAGLGFLAKGPVAVVIPLATTGAFCLTRGRTREWLRLVFDPVSLAIFAIIAVPWYALIVSREGWAFVDGFFGRHNIERFTRPLQGHAGSTLYYVPFAIAATMPFIAWAIPVARRIRAVWRDDAQCFLLLWFATVMVVFSIAATKLPHYILYGMTGPFILMAVYASALRSRIAALLPVVLLFLALAGLPAAIAAAPSHVANADVREMLGGAAASVPRGYFACMAVGLAATLWLMFHARVALGRALILAAAIVVTALHGFVAPVLAGARQTAVKEAAMFARSRGYDIVMWRLNAPSFSVYYGRPVSRRPPEPGEVVVTTAAAVRSLANASAHVLFAKNGVVLASMAK